MKRKSAFEKKYPLFVKYIVDEDVQKNMVENRDLLRKYSEYNETINIFLFELEKHFDTDTIRNIITEAILKTPDEIMISIITSYLNSDETVKVNPGFVLFYNRTSNLGIDSIEYIEKNGLITNRSYKDIPNLAIDQKYNELKSGEEVFKDTALEDVYITLTYPQRRYVNSLLETKSFVLLDALFGRGNFSLKSLIVILSDKRIDNTIINPDVYEKLGNYYLMAMLCMIIETDSAVRAVSNVKLLIASQRFELLKQLIIHEKVLLLEILNAEEINELSDNDILNRLISVDLNLLKKEG